MRSFCIGLGRWTVFLPWESDSVLYRPNEISGRIEFTGAAYVWPTAPTFGVDWTRRSPGGNGDGAKGL
jgi:hypothetical protein